MSNIYANTLNELEKIFLRKKNIVFLLITALIPVGAALSFNMLQSRLGIFAINSNSFSILMLGLFTSILFPLLIFSVVAELFSGELGDRTMKITLTRPITRFNVYLSKLVSIYIFTGINLGLVFVDSSVSGFFLKDSGTTINSFLQGLLAYIISLVPLFYLIVMATFVAQFFRSSGGAIITCVFVYIAAKLLPFLFPILGKISPFSYNDWYVTWLGNSIGLGRQLNILMLILSYTLIFLAAGYYFFDKRDI